MQEPHIRLKTARIAKGFRRAKDFTEENELNYNTYIAHESGKLPLSHKAAKVYAKHLNISESWLLYGEVSDDSSPSEFTPLRLKALEPLLLPFSVEAILKVVGRHNPDVDYKKLIDCGRNILSEIIAKTDDINKIKDLLITVTTLHKTEIEKSILKKG